MEPAILISLASLALPVFIAVGSRFRHAETTIQAYLRFLISSDLAVARAIVGTAARTNRRSKQATSATVRDAAFRLMWASQVAQPLVRRRVQGTKIARWEPQAVYQQLNFIIKDLSATLLTWGDQIDWAETGTDVNSLLDKMPVVKSE